MQLTRRKWIAMSATATIGATVARPSCSAAADDQTGLAVGFSTYGLPKLTLEQAIEKLTVLGYDCIEICVTPDRDTAPENMNYVRRRDINKRLFAFDLELSSLMSNLRPMDSLEKHRSDCERLKQICNLAHDLNPGSPPTIQTVLGGKEWDTRKDLCVERLADWVDIAERNEVTIAVKPHRGHAMSRPSEAAWLISQLNDPKQLKMWFDYSHFVFRDMSMEQTVEQSLPIMAGVAVKDAVQVDGKVKFELPGKAGTIDYKKLFKLLYAGGYRGDVIVEVSSQVWKQADYNADNAMRESYRAMSDALVRARIKRRH